MKCLGFDHIGINVSDLNKSFEFYDKFLPLLGFVKVKSTETSARWSNGKNSLSIKQTEEKYLQNTYHRKNPGINHLAFRADSKNLVDKFYKEFLSPNQIPTLYNSPKEFPQYREGYYAVFFEDRDRYKLEVMWAAE